MRRLTGNIRAGMLPAAPVLAALAILVAAPPPAYAQLAETPMASNMGQTTSTTALSTNNIVWAVKLTTGFAALGYPLESVDLVLGASPSQVQRDTIRVEMWRDASGSPGSKIFHLNPPPHPISAGTVTFRPPDDRTLRRSNPDIGRRSYWVVVYTTGSFDLDLAATDSDDEDEGTFESWSIGDASRFQTSNTPGAGSWGTQTANTPVMKVRVNGPPLTNDLSNLKVEGSTDGSTFTTLALTPAFAPETTRYTATVPYETTHVGVTPYKVSRFGTMALTLPGTPGTAGADTGVRYVGTLKVGDNEIYLDVIVETPNRTYRVTITRLPFLSTNANLSSLTATKATGGAPATFSSLSLSTTGGARYTATVPFDTTHVKVTPTVEDTGKATVRVGKAGSLTAVSSGSASSAISLAVGNNVIIARVTAEDTAVTKDYTVIVRRQAQDPPLVRLSVSQFMHAENGVGRSVSIRAVLSRDLGRDVSIRIVLLWGKGVENGQIVEYGTLAQGDLSNGMLGRVRITELNGQTYAALEFPTFIRIYNGSFGHSDAMHNVPLGPGAAAGKTFTVRLETYHPSWPSDVEAGDPSSEKVTIKATVPLEGGETPRQSDAPAPPSPLSGIEVCSNDEVAVGSDNCVPAIPTPHGYMASVNGSATHVTVAPTLAAARRNASLSVGKVTYPNGVETVSYGTVSSGSPSAAIELDEGGATIKVRVSGYGSSATIMLSVQKSGGGSGPRAVSEQTPREETAAEAQGYAARDGDPTQVEVAAALRELESGSQQGSPNRVPMVSRPLDDVSDLKAGSYVDISLGGVFSDPDSDSLTISASSSDTSVARVGMWTDYSVLTVGGVTEGTTSITVTADDGKGGTVSDTFTVRVRASPQPQQDTSTTSSTQTPEPEAENAVSRYDANRDGAIDVTEYRRAAKDYVDGKIDYSEMLEIIHAIFG